MSVRLSTIRRGYFSIGSFWGAFLSFTFVLCCFFPAQLAAQGKGKRGPDPRFEQLREQYQKLRNNDLELRQPEQWRVLSRSFEEYARKNISRPESSDALLRAAILSEELFRAQRAAADGERAAALAAEIERKFSDRPQADDAMLLAADLQQLNGRTAAAIETLTRLTTRFPRSELVPVAIARRTEFTAPATAPSPITSAKGKSSAKGETVVVLDPGHGGDDTGALGPAGIMEKDVALAISLEVERLLKQRSIDLEVVLTRRSDRFVPLAERTELANALEATVFVSIHANASPTGALSGVESYILDNSNDKASKRLADRENASVAEQHGEDLGMFDLSSMLSDLIQRGKQRESLVLASELQRSVLRHIRMLHGDARDLGVKRGPFFVLMGAKMPCVLLEVGFIDNEVDGVRLAEREYRNLIAQGIYVGIRRFLDQRSVE